MSRAPQMAESQGTAVCTCHEHLPLAMITSGWKLFKLSELKYFIGDYMIISKTGIHTLEAFTLTEPE